MNAPSGAISLSQAARLSGYHQDYLGQLCRAGKLQATKIGRTWFTTERSVRDFLTALQGGATFDFTEPNEEVDVEQTMPVRVQPLPTPSLDSAGPQVAENYVVSEVIGLPIKLEERPQLNRANTLDSAITKVRLQQVQRDLVDLTEAVQELAEQVEQNSKQIENLAVNGTAATFKHSYTPSLEFAAAVAPVVTHRNFVYEQPKRRNHAARILVVSGSMLLIAVAILLATNTAWQTKFFGQQSLATTIYHNLRQPQVAGDSVIVPTAIDQGTATVTNNNTNISKVPPAPSTPAETLGGIGAGNLLQ